MAQGTAIENPVINSPYVEPERHFVTTNGNDFAPERIILFGSRARGDQSQDSDDERTAAAEASLARAGDDLRSARVRLGHPHEMTAEIAAFHAQQAAEKALKALLIRRGVAIPRTHDLEELHRLVGGAFEPAAEELAPTGNRQVSRG